MQEKCTPQDATASTPHTRALEREQEALHRFNELSRAYFLLCEDRPERLVEIGRLMDEQARRLS